MIFKGTASATELHLLNVQSGLMQDWLCAHLCPCDDLNCLPSRLLNDWRDTTSSWWLSHLQTGAPCHHGGHGGAAPLPTSKLIQGGLPNKRGLRSKAIKNTPGTSSVLAASANAATKPRVQRGLHQPPPTGKFVQQGLHQSPPTDKFVKRGLHQPPPTDKFGHTSTGNERMVVSSQPTLLEGNEENSASQDKRNESDSVSRDDMSQKSPGAPSSNDSLTLEDGQVREPLLEATLVPETRNSQEGIASSEIFLAAPMETDKGTFVTRNIPDSLGGKLFCIALALFATAMALTGILCGSGLCSSRGNDDGESVVMIPTTPTPHFPTTRSSTSPTTLPVAAPLVPPTKAPNHVNVFNPKPTVPTTNSPTTIAPSYPPSLNSDLVVTATLFGENTIGAYDLVFSFQDGQSPLQDPTEEQLRALICPTQEYFSGLLQINTANAAAEFQAVDIGYRRKVVDSRLQVVVTFDCSFLSSNGNSLFENDTSNGFPSLSFFLEDFDSGFNSTEYIKGYVHKAAPRGIRSIENYFANVDMVSTKRNLAPPTERFLKETRCIVPEEVFFTIQYGIASEMSRAPTTAEIEDLVCQTSLFVRDQVRHATGNDTIVAIPSQVGWQYEEIHFLPIAVDFAMEVSYGENGGPVSRYDVFDAMMVTTSDIEDYIQFYVWETNPDSVFQDTNAANFTNQANIYFPQGKLDTVGCPSSPPSPTRTARPTSMHLTARPNSAPSVRPSVSPSTHPPTIAPIAATAPPLSTGTAIPAISTNPPTIAPIAATAPALSTGTPIPAITTTVHQCKLYMFVADTNKNSYMGTTEYVAWLNRIIGSSTYTTFATLPQPLQALYIKYATIYSATAEIDINGARDGTVPTSPEQGDSLDTLCAEAFTTFLSVRPSVSPSIHPPIAPTSDKVILFQRNYYRSTTTRIDLHNKELKGTVPTKLGLLTALTGLKLHDNQLTGPIPTELGLLTALTRLYLYINQLTGPIPTELGLMTALTGLELYNNQLKGTIPTELGLMIALTSLSLNENQLTGPIPTQLGLLTVLTWLRLFTNQLTGTVPNSLCSQSELEIQITEGIELKCPANCGKNCLD